MKRAVTSRRCVVLLLSLVVLMVWAPSVAAQQAPVDVPRIEQAEQAFNQALQAFADGDYGLAYRRFRLVYEGYPVHRKTTAAILMGGKALYRDGAFRDAITLLSEFRRLYPTSSYLDEAERTLIFAERQLRVTDTSIEPLRLGILLPMNDEDMAFTQALFNGIRLAVEDHNQDAARPAKMIFRNTHNRPADARRAVRSLVEDERVDAIIGPLYSEEAAAAADAAEQIKAILIPPLATDETIARRRSYVFQANPSIAMRGRLMARYAVRNLRHQAIGIISEQGVPNSLGERMAESFQQEALRLGVDVRFYQLLPPLRAWAELPQQIGADTLGQVTALYLPVSSRNARRLIEDALTSLDLAGLTPQILGNSEWRNAPFRQQASDYSVTFADDFYVDETDPRVQSFGRRYRDLAGEAPDRLAYVGYDVADFLLQHMGDGSAEELRQRLRAAPLYNGLGTRISFTNGTSNDAMFYLRYRDARIELAR